MLSLIVAERKYHLKMTTVVDFACDTYNATGRVMFQSRQEKKI